MRTYTNMTRPDDPYRTGQQLYRRPSRMLAAFATLPRPRGPATAPAAAATAYLVLHRTRVIEITLAFGFRAASAASSQSLPQLVQIADLDLLQARRHAAFLAGHELSPELRGLRTAAPGLVTRGLAAVESGWSARHVRPRGTAAMIDISADLGGGHADLAAICRWAGIDPSPAAMSLDQASGDPADPGAAERLAAAAAERALVAALACARGLGRYRWDGIIRTEPVMAATTWDLFPLLTWDDTPDPDRMARAREREAPTR